MVTKHFAYADCNSDSRYSHKEHMKDVYFIKFPHGKKNSDRCKKWVDACYREDFNLSVWHGLHTSALSTFLEEMDQQQIIQILFPTFNKLYHRWCLRLSITNNHWLDNDVVSVELPHNGLYFCAYCRLHRFILCLDLLYSVSVFTLQCIYADLTTCTLALLHTVSTSTIQCRGWLYTYHTILLMVTWNKQWNPCF